MMKDRHVNWRLPQKGWWRKRFTIEMRNELCLMIVQEKNWLSDAIDVGLLLGNQWQSMAILSKNNGLLSLLSQRDPKVDSCASKRPQI